MAGAYKAAALPTGLRSRPDQAVPSHRWAKVRSARFRPKKFPAAVHLVAAGQETACSKASAARAARQIAGSLRGRRAFSGHGEIRPARCEAPREDRGCRGGGDQIGAISTKRL